MEEFGVEGVSETTIEKCQQALRDNNFEVFRVKDEWEAQQLILNEIVPFVNPESISWGDSMTLHETNVLEELEKQQRFNIIKTFEQGLVGRELIERRRQALLVDLFFTGSNAVTESGQLVNLDMIGNRVAGITFGPKKVVIVVGSNKIVSDLEQAKNRIRQHAAPKNAVRHQFKTPCTKTGTCMDCKSSKRICNTWTITEKSLPKGRIKIVLIDKALGL